MACNFYLLFIDFMKSIKWLIFLWASIFTMNQLSAQVYFDAPSLINDGQSKIGLGITGGGNLSNNDFGLSGNGTQYGAFANFAPVRFLHLNIDFNVGQLKGGPMQLLDKETYKSVSFNTEFTQIAGIVRFLPLRIFMWDKMDPLADRFTYLYFGLGYGNISTNTEATLMKDPYFGSMPSLKESNSVFIQEVGMDISLLKIGNRKNDYYSKISKQELFLNINYRFNKISSDNIDGFNPPLPSNKHNDVYSSYSLGLMYRF